MQIHINFYSSSEIDHRGITGAIYSFILARPFCENKQINTSRPSQPYYIEVQNVLSKFLCSVCHFNYLFIYFYSHQTPVLLSTETFDIYNVTSSLVYIRAASISDFKFLSEKSCFIAHCDRADSFKYYNSHEPRYLLPWRRIQPDKLSGAK